MRSVRLIIAALGVGVVAWVALAGGLDGISAWALEIQRETQTHMALGLRALRAGEPGALLGLLGLCFVYGLAHAAGPGHGKVLLGAYGLASRATLRRLTLLAFASALAQAVTAIVLVSIGALVLGFGRDQIGMISDQTMTAISVAAIGAVGAWLVARGVRRAWRLWQAERPPADHTHHHHHHDPDASGRCAGCGHRHGPNLAEAEHVHSLRDALALILSIGIRPCTGAVFVLLLTFQMGIPIPGIAAVVAMAVGTGMVTAIVALGAGFWRQHSLPQTGRGALYGTATLEMLMGAAVMLLSFGVLRSLL